MRVTLFGVFKDLKKATTRVVVLFSNTSPECVFYVAIVLESRLGWGFQNDVSDGEEIGSGEENGGAGSGTTIASKVPPVPGSLKSRFMVGCLYGAIAILGNVTNITATALVFAYYLQAVSLLQPFMVVVISRGFLSETRIPPLFYTSVICSSLGLMVMLFGDEIEVWWHSSNPMLKQTEKSVIPRSLLKNGEELAAHYSAQHEKMTNVNGKTKSLFFDINSWTGTTAGTALGIGLRVIASLCASSRRVMMKASEKVGLRGIELLIYHNIWGIGSLVGIIVYTQDYKHWQAWMELTWLEWAYFFWFAALINFGAQLLQIESTRQLGPTLQSSFTPCRSISTLILSYVILNEPMTSLVSWFGLIMLSISLIIYFRRQLEPEPKKSEE